MENMEKLEEEEKKIEIISSILVKAIIAIVFLGCLIAFERKVLLIEFSSIGREIAALGFGALIYFYTVAFVAGCLYILNFMLEDLEDAERSKNKKEKKHIIKTYIEIVLILLLTAVVMQSVFWGIILKRSELLILAVSLFAILTILICIIFFSGYLEKKNS